MATTPIEQWTREQCEAYLKQYPKSLRSDAVRKRLEGFTPAQEPHTSDQKIGNGQQADANASLSEILDSVFGNAIRREHSGKTNGSSDEMPDSVFENATRQEYSDMINGQDAMKGKSDMWIIIVCIIGAVAGFAIGMLTP